MSMWLKKRLTIWLGVSLCGALLWNSGASRAQMVNRSRKLSRDQATTQFRSIMNALPQVENPDYISFPGLPGSVSLKSERELGERMEALFKLIAFQWKRPNGAIKAQEFSPTDAERPLVVVEEDGNWGVDLVETYAKWNNLQGVAKAEAIYKVTGVALKDLPRKEERNCKVCQTNLRMIAIGIKQYAQDHDGKLPPAKSWTDVVKQYMPSAELLRCPSVRADENYGYAYNSKLSNKMKGQIHRPNQTIVVYETSVLKRNAYGVGENRAFRHQNGANYAFADGHVKWFPIALTPGFKLKP